MRCRFRLIARECSVLIAITRRIAIIFLELASRNSQLSGLQPWLVLNGMSNAAKSDGQLSPDEIQRIVVDDNCAIGPPLSPDQVQQKVGPSLR